MKRTLFYNTKRFILVVVTVSAALFFTFLGTVSTAVTAAAAAPKNLTKKIDPLPAAYAALPGAEFFDGVNLRGAETGTIEDGAHLADKTSPADCRTKFPYSAERVEFSLSGNIAGVGMPEYVVRALAPDSIKVKGTYAIDAVSGTVIFAGNENERHPIASMQKIMTALLIFEAIEDGKLSFDSDIYVSERASGMGGSQIFLDAGTTHKLSGLLKSIIVASANDSCVAVAETVSGSEESFVADMNRRAAELGMANTHFVNCTGLPADGQYSCAADVAAMMRALISHKEYFDYSSVWLENYVHPDGRETVMTNTNKLVRTFNGCDGGKTGYTSEAKFCVSATARRGDMRLIAVVVGAEDGAKRFETAAALLNGGFAGYENRKVVDSEKPYAAADVKRGRVREAAVYAERPAYVFCAKNSEREVRFESALQSIKAPVKAGERVGTLTVYVDGVKTDEISLIVKENIEKSKLIDEIKKIAGKF